MLSVFPELFFLAPFAALIIRLALSAVFIYAALQHVKNSDMTARVFGVVETIVAAALLAGAWTQPTAIAGVLLLSSWLFLPNVRSVATGTALLSIVLAITLIITGAGPLAFDLPL